MAPIGKRALCFWRLKRSSAAAATGTPSTTSAAAESCPWEIRYSLSSRPGQFAFLKAMAGSRPLIPRMFISLQSTRLPEALLDEGAVNFPIAIVWHRSQDHPAHRNHVVRQSASQLSLQGGGRELETGSGHIRATDRHTLGAGG